MLQKIKRISIILLLVVHYQAPLIQAMDNGHTFTDLAQAKEDQGEAYVSPQGLNYTRKNTVKKRIEHIKKHLTDDKNRKKHTFFNVGTAAHVVDNYDGIQHIYDIKPNTTTDVLKNFSVIGTQGGSTGGGVALYGYRLSLSHTTTGVEIETFFPI